MHPCENEDILAFNVTKGPFIETQLDVELSWVVSL